MGNDGQQAQLLGFLLPDGVPGRDVTLLPVGEGLTVLYGLNGAGKTRTLTAVRNFWAGIRDGNTMALVRLADPGTEYNERDFARYGESRDWANDWLRHAGKPPVPVWLANGDSAEAALREWVFHCIDFDPDETPASGRVGADRREALVDEWHTQRLIVVMAGGSEERPLWFSTPAAVTSSTARTLNWAADLYERCSGEDDFDEWHVVAMAPCGRLTTGETILYAGPRGTTLIDRPEEVGAIHDWLIPVGVTRTYEGSDVDIRTLHLLTSAAAGDEIEVVGDAVRPSALLARLVADLEENANRYFSCVLVDAPALACRIDVVGLSAGVAWLVDDFPSAFGPGWGRSLEGLSTAQQRWATWAIGEAIHDMEVSCGLDGGNGDLTRRLGIIDEPEGALHRSAEAHMAAFIATAAERGDRSFLVATHSPELLDSTTAHLVEVSQRDGRRLLAPLTDIDRESMQRLGLSPSDLLRRQRGFLLVEGQHDVDVLSILMGDALRRLRVEILPLRGATELSAPKSRFLFHYTPAHLFVVLDNVDTEYVYQTWERVRYAYLSEGLDAARAQLGSAFPKKRFGKGNEAKFLSEFLSAALEEGNWGRVTPFGLQLGDIIEYLPVRMLVPGKRSWSDLREAYTSACSQGDSRNFKTWLRGHGGDTSDSAIRRAAGAMDALPDDLARLLKTIEAKTLD